MRYLKKFNEELKSRTYKNAAYKLGKILKDKPKLGKLINAQSRIDRLNAHSKYVSRREELERWKENVKDYSKYGEFNIELSQQIGGKIVKKVYTVYLNLNTDVDSTADGINWQEDVDNRTITFQFGISIIPKNIEDVEDILKDEHIDFHNGSIWCFWLFIRYSVVNSEVTFKGISLEDYDFEDFVQINDRKSANSLKRVITNIFDQTFDYPSGYTDVTNMYDKIEQSLIQKLDLSSDYGIDMGKIKGDVAKLPYTDFFRQ